MKINRNFWKRVARTAASAAIVLVGTVGENALKARDGETAQVGRFGRVETVGQTAEVAEKAKTAKTPQNGEVASTAPSDAWVEDGFPLIYRRDGAALEAIWNALEPSETKRFEQTWQVGQTERSGETKGKSETRKTPSEPFAEAVDFQLRRQGPKYKGKTLALRGRLLRAVWVPTANGAAQNGEVAQVGEAAQNSEVAQVGEAAQNGGVSASGANKENGESGGFYDLWVLLPDSKRDPIRLLTRRAPPGFNVDERLENATAYPETVEYRRETVEATAVYYRTTAFDGGDDFYAAPTLVAVDFRWSGSSASADGESGDGEKGTRTGGALAVKIGVCVGIVAVWLSIRRFVGRKSAGKTGKRGKRGKNALDLPDSIEPFALLLVATGAFVGALRAETPEVAEIAQNTEIAQDARTEQNTEIAQDAGTAQKASPGEVAQNSDDAAFWSVATGVELDAWRRETAISEDEPRPKLDSSEAVDRRRIAVATFERLTRLVSPSVLAERFGGSENRRNSENGKAAALVGTLGDYVAAAPSERPTTVPGASVRYFCGTALRVERLATGADEAARIGGAALYRVVVALDSAENGETAENGEDGETASASKTLVVYSPNVPKFAAPSSFFDANGKRAKRGKESKTEETADVGDLEKPGELANVGVGERVGGLGVLFGREADGAVALAARIGWFPTDAPLGRLGVDLSAFEGAPVYPIRALTAEKDPTRRREIARTLRWTSADSRPFYETLAAVRRDSQRNEKTILAPDSSFASETEKTVALFNRPEQNQGRVVRLRGRVRRANLVLVDDPDVVAATGIDRYYQLYLFSNDSQGWPLVLCVPELPDGLKTGGGKEYRREIEFVGAFTKNWAYKTSAQRTQILQDAQTPQSAETSQSARSGQSVQNAQTPQSAEASQSARSGQSVQKAQTPQSAETLQSARSGQSVQNAQTPQSAEALQSARSGQTAQNVAPTGPGTWGRVPVLVGRVARVVPEEPEPPKAPVSPTALVAGFAVLAAAWIALRRRAARPPRTGRR